MISAYSKPDSTLYRESSGTVLACRYNGDSSLIVVDFTSIMSVVGMVPHRFSHFDIKEDWHFVVEKPGLDVACLGGAYDNEEGGSDLDNVYDVIT